MARVNFDPLSWGIEQCEAIKKLKEDLDKAWSEVP